MPKSIAMMNDRKFYYDDFKSDLTKKRIVYVVSKDIKTGSLGNIFREASDALCSDKLIFRDCTFFMDFGFYDIDLAFNIVFEDCVFKNGLIIKTSKIGKQYSEEDRQRLQGEEALIIKNCRGIGIISIIGNTFLSDVCLMNVKALNTSDYFNLNIEGNHSEFGLKIDTCFFSGDLKADADTKIGSNSFKKWIVIDKNNFPYEMNLQLNRSDHFSFRSNNVGGSIVLSGELGKIVIGSNVFNNYVFIRHVFGCISMEVVSNSFSQSCEINHLNSQGRVYTPIEMVIFHGNSALGEILFDGSSGEGVNVFIDELDVKADGKMKGDLRIADVRVNKVCFKGAFSGSAIQLEKVELKKLDFERFSNTSKVRFFNLKVETSKDNELSMQSSNLGSMEFYNTDLDCFGKVSIKNSVLSEIISSNVNWFNRVKLFPPKGTSDSESETGWKNAREVFRQLKLAMDKQGNRIQALEFQSAEMYAYRNELKLKPFFPHLVNKAVLWAGLSNDHGINWVKPIIISVLSTLFFYVAIVISASPKIGFSIANSFGDLVITLDEFRKYSHAFFKMYNPVFVFDKVFEVKMANSPNSNVCYEGLKSVTFWTSFWEFTHRIVVSYLIFQTVSAFRKFVRT